MHFRLRGNNIQVVQSRPDPTIGRAKSVPIGSINRATLAISDKLRQNCSPAELKEIEALVRRYQAIDAHKRKHAALTLPEQLAAAIQWFREADPKEARAVADDIMVHTQLLRKMLDKRGLL